MQEKVQKGDFQKKGLMRIDSFYLFYVPMNPSKAWNAKLEGYYFFYLKTLKVV